VSDLPALYRVELRRARKPHRCCECHGTIRPKESCWFHHGLWDGEFLTFKVCSECEELRKRINADVQHEDERTPLEGLSEAVEALSDSQPELLRGFVETKVKRGAPVSDWMAEKARSTNEE